jgi:hypothetical protein
MLYNSISGIVLFIFLFIGWTIQIGYTCPCKGEGENICIRQEFYGIQLNHLMLFIIIGMIFPSYFFTFMLFGVLWEIYEFILDNNENIVNEYIGGCLSEKPKNFKHINTLSDSYIFKGDIKYLNPIDKFFNIQNSRNHFWHGSVAELLPNIIGFSIGYLINSVVIKI